MIIYFKFYCFEFSSTIKKQKGDNSKISSTTQFYLVFPYTLNPWIYNAFKTLKIQKIQLLHAFYDLLIKYSSNGCSSNQTCWFNCFDYLLQIFHWSKILGKWGFMFRNPAFDSIFDNQTFGVF